MYYRLSYIIVDMNPIIINAAITGMVPTRAMTPHVPLSVKEIVANALECARLGASIIHIHPRDEQGKPTPRQDLFEQIIAGIRAKNKEVLISVTTSGRLWNEFSKRSLPLEIKEPNKPDLASLTLGSLNFISQESVNSPEMIEALALKMKERGIKPEIEIFEPGMIHKAKYLMKKGVLSDIKPYFNILLGSLGTSPLEPSTVAAMIALLPPGAVWSFAGVGAYQLDTNVLGLSLGGNVRLGLEDNIFFDREKKVLATNQAMIKRLVKIATLMQLTIATPKQTRALLGL